ncbi:hypothetical protein EWM64_g7260 [Hericium alpestre]|uniref:Uncharacterized protein n=1 Tax=Hericium alpestre TaxID=135208 RepID=A0A4Y9ZPP7_9AGAM|nr:hypothetical protein EWM64_g7260 [Hericium alpestre]
MVDLLAISAVAMSSCAYVTDKRRFALVMAKPALKLGPHVLSCCSHRPSPASPPYALPMSIFEPKAIHACIQNVLPTESERKKFNTEWSKLVSKHRKTWGECNAHADEKISQAQFEWVGEVLAYIAFLFKKTRLHGNAGADKKPPSLKLRVPILGPCFVPPGYLQLEKWSGLPKIMLETAYLQPINVVHPFYSPRLNRCPRYRGSNIWWYGWTSTGLRLVYGMRRSEWAIGYQLRCKDCKKEREELFPSVDEEEDVVHYSWVMTNAQFWESWEYWEVPSITISIDMTFESTKKAALTSSNGTRTTPHRKGGLLSAINEVRQCVDWELCQSQSNAEIENFLVGLGQRIDLHHDMIAAAVRCEEVVNGLQDESDPCSCDLDLLANGPSLSDIKLGAPPAKWAIEKAFPDAAIGLDVHHCSQRYLATVIGATSNPYHAAVAKDLKDAILISSTDGEQTEKYWTKEEQELKLEAVYAKWAEHGSVWIKVFVTLGHDHVLRRNLRIAWSSGKTSSLVISTYGSHHLQLVNHNSKLWNSLLDMKAHQGQQKNQKWLLCRPEMLIVPSKEKFGLRPLDPESYGGLIRMKDEQDEDEPDLLEQLEGDELSREMTMHKAIHDEIGIDMKAFYKPTSSMTSASSTLVGTMHVGSAPAAPATTTTARSSGALEDTRTPKIMDACMAVQASSMAQRSQNARDHNAGDGSGQPGTMLPVSTLIPSGDMDQREAGRLEPSTERGSPSGGTNSGMVIDLTTDADDGNQQEQREHDGAGTSHPSQCSGSGSQGVPSKRKAASMEQPVQTTDNSPSDIGGHVSKKARLAQDARARAKQAKAKRRQASSDGPLWTVVSAIYTDKSAAI